MPTRDEDLFAKWDRLLSDEGMPAELHPSRGQLGISQFEDYVPMQGKVEQGALGMGYAELPMDLSRDVRNRLEYPVDPVTLDCMYMHLLNVGKTTGRERPWNKQSWLYKRYRSVFDEARDAEHECSSHTEYIKRKEDNV